MKIEHCLFVCGSDVFKGQNEVWVALCESDPDCSFGNNNRSLVSRDFLLTALDGIDAKGVRSVRSRLERLPAEVYIDLEN
jgi:hypothetical protein